MILSKALLISFNVVPVENQNDICRNVPWFNVKDFRVATTRLIVND